MGQHVKPGNRRARSYDLKTDPKHIADINTRQKRDMEVHHKAAQYQLAKTETAAKLMLDAAGVYGVSYVSYLNFVRECWKLEKRRSGEGLARSAAVIQLKWHARGLDNAIMSALKFELFSIAEPSVPIP